MTESAAQILIQLNAIPVHKISIIAHGTHLIKHQNRQELKAKYSYHNRKIISTFGLISAGKNIETTL